MLVFNINLYESLHILHANYLPDMCIVIFSLVCDLPFHLLNGYLKNRSFAFNKLSFLNFIFCFYLYMMYIAHKNR